MPHFPSEFEIPDDWLSQAGTVGFKPTARAYRSTAAATMVPLTEIEPVARFVAYSIAVKTSCATLS
jgi:hypothetical protein